MSRADGGITAASGFYYQYLATLSRLVDLLEQDLPAGVAMHVESSPADPPTTPTSSTSAWRCPATDRLLEVAQVKSSSVARALTLPETSDALLRLITFEADRYTPVTNAPLTGPADKLRVALAAATGELPGMEHRTPVGRRTDACSSRCRISVDDRSSLELRNVLRERLRAYRTARRRGVGHEAAGLLTGYLVSEIFELAGPRTDRVMTLDEFSELVLFGAPTLAWAVGAKWGVPLGAAPRPPDIERPGALEQLVDILRPDQIPDRVHTCVITGLSGLGKTSLAAGYSHEYADAYDFIVWIESETVDTIRASVSDILAQARTQELPTDDDVSLQRGLHHLLASHPGTWLAVFDGALMLKATKSWLPPRGNGHVLITSTNSTDWTQFSQVPLEPMSAPEALALVTKRLDRLIGSADAAEDPRLRELVDAMERWPLALELACAYILSTGLEIDDIPAFMHKLRARALADEALELVSYPRTLVAAIEACLDRIADQADFSNIDEPYHVAHLLVRVIAYLASRRIPVHLALCCALLPEDQKLRLAPGPAVIQAAHFEPREVVRILMSQSLVTADRAVGARPPPGASSGVVGTSWTVSTNEVVQEVIRLTTDNDEAARERLKRIVFHVQDWLQGYVDERDFVRLAIVEPHAAAVLEHAQRRRLVTPEAATLLGNLAVTYHGRGLLEEATELLERELALLHGMSAPPSILHVKIYQELAAVSAEMFLPSDRVLAPITTALACIRAGALPPASLSKEIQNMLNLTTLLERREDADADAIATAQTELRGLHHAAGGGGYGDEVNAIQGLIVDGKDAEALERAAAVLEAGGLMLEGRIQITGLKLECLARLKRWPDTREPLEFLRAANDGTPFFGERILDQLMNGGLGAMDAVVDDDPDARAFFREIMTASDSLLRSGVHLTAGARARLAVMRGFAATLEEDEAAARQAAADFHLPDLERSDTASTLLYQWMNFVTRKWLADRT